MFRVRLLAIMRKELLEMMRGMGWFWLFGILISPLLQAQIVYTYIRSARTGRYDEQLLSFLITLTLMFVGPLVVPMWTYTPLSRRLQREQSVGELLPLLSTGVSSGTLFIGKLLAAFLGAYLVLLICLVENVLIILMYFKVSILWDGALWTVILVSGPIASLSISALSFFLAWLSKGTVAIAGYVPAILSFGLWAVALRPASMLRVGGPLGVIHLAAAGSVVVVVGLTVLANSLPRRRIAGL